jgi:hypothetical protein
MSRFWSRILRFQPRFEGSEEELRENVDSHVWHNFRFSDVYSEASDDLPPIVTCRVCGIMADSNAATWRCGEAPPEIPYSEWLMKREKPTG